MKPINEIETTPSNGRNYRVEMDGDVLNGFTVMAVGEKRDDGSQYRGPSICITHDETWLHLTTDDYEGHAMINIETLPKIIESLQLIQRARRDLNDSPVTGTPALPAGSHDDPATG